MHHRQRPRDSRPTDSEGASSRGFLHLRRARLKAETVARGEQFAERVAESPTVDGRATVESERERTMNRSKSRPRKNRGVRIGITLSPEVHAHLERTAEFSRRSGAAEVVGVLLRELSGSLAEASSDPVAFARELLRHRPGRPRRAREIAFERAGTLLHFPSR